MFHDQKFVSSILLELYHKIVIDNRRTVLSPSNMVHPKNRRLIYLRESLTQDDVNLKIYVQKKEELDDDYIQQSIESLRDNTWQQDYLQSGKEQRRRR